AALSTVRRVSVVVAIVNSLDWRRLGASRSERVRPTNCPLSENSVLFVPQLYKNVVSFHRPPEAAALNSCGRWSAVALATSSGQAFRDRVRRDEVPLSAEPLRDRGARWRARERA